ncbi:hypothetical protein EJB05_32082 [Eragrostis curvula]|uniref:HMA domain-containing protein n=1 Tax=Eragrostis curvula TaxID=38414 RepID=A0A5J9UGT4_9POAL|nr:hypothetical protein EJB05_32082 [Eragrostis curvula]
MDIDAEKCTLTVVGEIDPVCIVQKLKKKCFEAKIISVGDDKPPEKKDPIKEACEKLCKEKCDKLCCKVSKEKCEKECKEKCENNCKAWLEKGCCSCSSGCSTSPGFHYDPCAVPRYPYCHGAYGSSGWPNGVVYCYEERSPAGQCGIQ